MRTLTCAYVRVHIRGLEMLVFRKILSTYLMDGPLKKQHHMFINFITTDFDILH